MADTAATPAQNKPAAPAAPAKTDREKKLETELGAVRAELAQEQEKRKQERRTSDPRSKDYDAALAQEEAWPGQVRESN